MHKSARLSAILDRLASGGTVDVGGLAKELAASHATIRRDLATLERQRLLQLGVKLPDDLDYASLLVRLERVG